MTPHQERRKQIIAKWPLHIKLQFRNLVTQQMAALGEEKNGWDEIEKITTTAINEQIAYMSVDQYENEMIAGAKLKVDCLVAERLYRPMHTHAKPHTKS